MRNLIDIIMESMFEPSDYGYWIEPEGKIVSCSRFSHAEAAAAQLGLLDGNEDDFDGEDEESERDVIDEAMTEGAIRVIASKGSSEFNAEWSEFAVTSAAKRSLMSVMALYQNRQAYVMQDEWFSDYREALRYLRSH